MAGAQTVESTLQLCNICHGPVNQAISLVSPRLAGLDSDYLQRQIKHYREGKRQHAAMSALATMLDKPLAVAVSDHYSKQKPTPAPAGDATLAKLGKRIYEEGIEGTSVSACADCHGSDATGESKYPRLAGQDAAYIEVQLRAFKLGERNNDTKAAMREAAKDLTPEHMRALAEYLSALKTEP